MIECIFGVLKKCFKILRETSDWPIQTQGKILPGVAVVHNFIRTHDREGFREEENELETELGLQRTEHVGNGDGLGVDVTDAEREQAGAKRDKIAMWRSYQKEIQRRNQSW